MEAVIEQVEHEVTINRDIYITKVMDEEEAKGNGHCYGCVCKNICLEHYFSLDKCSPYRNSDGKHRIWVKKENV